VHDFDRSLTIDVSIAGDHSHSHSHSHSTGDNATPTTEKVLFGTADGWVLSQQGEARCVRMPVRVNGRSGARNIWRLCWQEPMQRAHIRVDGDLVDKGVVRHLAQYLHGQIVLTTLLAAEGALLVHACDGRTRADGIAVAGVSGAGKSTLDALA
jgi:hypothetical protein